MGVTKLKSKCYQFLQEAEGRLCFLAFHRPPISLGLSPHSSNFKARNVRDSHSHIAICRILRFLPTCLFLSVLGLHCYTQALSSCGEQGLLSSWGMQASVCRAWALGTQAHVASALRLSSCDAWVSLPHGVWDLPQLGIKPVSPALAGRFFSIFF